MLPVAIMLSSLLAVLQYVTYCTSGFVDDMFAHNGQAQAMQEMRILNVIHYRRQHRYDTATHYGNTGVKYDVYDCLLFASYFISLKYFVSLFDVCHH